MTSVFFDQIGREKALLEVGLTVKDMPRSDGVPVDVFGSALESETQAVLQVEMGAKFHEADDNDPKRLVRGVGFTGVSLANETPGNATPTTPQTSAGE